MIEQCAPVLAGLKPAGLFRYETRDCADLARRVRSWNEQLGRKGLCVRVLKGCMRTHQYLVYVYRESRLRVLLAQPQVRDFLRGEGTTFPSSRMTMRRCCGSCPGGSAMRLIFPMKSVYFWATPSRCGGLYRKSGPQLHLLRLLEGLRRPRCRRTSFCPVEQVHQSVSAPVPRGYPHFPPCCGGLTSHSLPILSFYPGTHRNKPRSGGKKSSF